MAATTGFVVAMLVLSLVLIKPLASVGKRYQGDRFPCFCLPSRQYQKFIYQSIFHLGLLFRFPSDSSNPRCPRLHIFPLQNSFHTPPFLGQFFVTGDPMYEAVARSAEPCHALELPLLMPASLEDFGVNLTRDQMMVCQGHPVTIADLALGGLLRGIVRRRRCRAALYVPLNNWSHEFGNFLGIGDEMVGHQRVAN